MTNTRLFKKTVLAAALTLASQQAIAAGFQLNSQSATGLGRAFAGDAVIADNASSMARNAATMALFDETSLSLGVVTITSLIEVKDATYTNSNGSTHTSNFDNAGTTSFPPNFHLIVPVDDKWSWGVDAYSNFGTRTEFDSSFSGSEFGGETEILSMNFGAVVSYRIDEKLSLGAGIDFIYGQGTLKRNYSSNFYDGPVTSLAPMTLYLDSLNGGSAMDINKADGWGVGYNIGVVYEANEDNRYGLAYRYSPDIEAKDGEKKVTLPLPDMAEFSGYHRLKDSKFAVHYSAQFIRWSEFERITFENVGTTESMYNWKDTYHISLGTTYYMNETWTLRAGYMYDESAQDENTSISVPDSDRNWFSAGFTYQMTDKSNIDLGFTYLLGRDVGVTEDNGTTSIVGTTHADAILLGLQYSRTF
jgi:long-chain fatty acid transport protein